MLLVNIMNNMRMGTLFFSLKKIYNDINNIMIVYGRARYQYYINFFLCFASGRRCIHGSLPRFTYHVITRIIISYRIILLLLLYCNRPLPIESSSLYYYAVVPNGGRPRVKTLDSPSGSIREFKILFITSDDDNIPYLRVLRTVGQNITYQLTYI